MFSNYFYKILCGFEMKPSIDFFGYALHLICAVMRKVIDKDFLQIYIHYSSWCVSKYNDTERNLILQETIIYVNSYLDEDNKLGPLPLSSKIKKLDVTVPLCKLGNEYLERHCKKPRLSAYDGHWFWSSLSVFCLYGHTYCGGSTAPRLYNPLGGAYYCSYSCSSV